MTKTPERFWTGGRRGWECRHAPTNTAMVIRRDGHPTEAAAAAAYRNYTGFDATSIKLVEMG